MNHLVHYRTLFDVRTNGILYNYGQEDRRDFQKSDDIQYIVRAGKYMYSQLV